MITKRNCSAATRGESQKKRKLGAMRRQMQREIGRQGQRHFPPKGFSIEVAKVLFRMTGELEDWHGPG